MTPKSLLLFACSITAAVCLWLGLSVFAEAQGADAVPAVTVDAGPSTATPSPTAIAVPDVPEIKTPDPLERPADALSAERVAWKVGPLYGVLFGLLMLAKMVQARATPGTWLGDKLGTGAGATYMASGTMIVTALMGGITHAIPWGTVVLVAAGALLALWNPHPKPTVR